MREGDKQMEGRKKMRETEGGKNERARSWRVNGEWKEKQRKRENERE